MPYRSPCATLTRGIGTAVMLGGEGRIFGRLRSWLPANILSPSFELSHLEGLVLPEINVQKPQMIVVILCYKLGESQEDLLICSRLGG